MSLDTLHPHEKLSTTAVFKTGRFWCTSLAKTKGQLEGFPFSSSKKSHLCRRTGSPRWLLESLRWRMAPCGRLDQGVSKYSQAMDFTKTPPSIWICGEGGRGERRAMVGEENSGHVPVSNFTPPSLFVSPPPEQHSALPLLICTPCKQQQLSIKYWNIFRDSWYHWLQYLLTKKDT